MTGKISSAEKNIKNGNKLNLGKISSKSILSYQNSNASGNVESRECTNGDEGMPAEGYPDDGSMSEDNFLEGHNLKNECLDILRKKLISDLSLSVFSDDLENKFVKMEPIAISKERQAVVQKLLVQISQLSDAEKLLLYLKLPSSTSSPFDPLRQPLNPLGNRQEIQQTIVWIKTHLEEDSEISIPKQDVYDQYLKYCENVSMKPLSTADFGKVMKQVYPGVRPRRLGTRGNSRYCYSGMKNTCKLPTPVLPQFETSIISEGLGDGPPLLNNVNKKADKTKRKWKSSGCRLNKNATSTISSNPTSDKETVNRSKNIKRSKLEESKEKNEHLDSNNERIGSADLNGLKLEESSNNSFNGFDVENNFELCLPKEDAPTRLEITPNSSLEEKFENIPKGSEKILLEAKEKPLKEDHKNTPERVTNLEEMRSKNVKVNVFNGNVNGFENNENSKTSQTKLKRLSSISKTKNYKKSYFPIQPKLETSNMTTIRFEKPHMTKENAQRDWEGMTLCDESDSQEPEEEIVRYFKHLEEGEMKSNGLVSQAVKNLKNDLVQNINICPVSVNSRNSLNYVNEDNALNQTPQPQYVIRSQSCFEVPKLIFNHSENPDSVFTPRSQSLGEMPLPNIQMQQQGMESSVEGKKKKYHI